MAESSHAAAGSAAASDVTLQVSFEQAASVRLRGDRFVASGADVSAVNAALRGPSLRVERLFGASEVAIDAQRRRLHDKGKRGVPDLNRHFRIVARDAGARDRLVAALAALSVVDDVFAEPEPAPAPATPSFTGQQRYRGASPVGVDAAALAARPGGRGEHVKIVDIEYSWNRSHEDLTKAAPASVLIPNGTPSDPFPDKIHHGTAVLGELIADDNGFGVTGLAPGSEIALVNANSTTGWKLPEAVSLAHSRMTAGDVLLLEQQYDPPGNGDDYVAAEYWPAVYDAIKLATQDGIIVVEPAGNGSVNLDAGAYGSPFPQGKSDSGAILVGAGSGDAFCSDVPNARVPLSTHGSRVNLQGWGTCVTTTGFGALYNGGTANALYTSNFNGTSSAAAMVAGAAALFSSVFQGSTAIRRPPTPQFVRDRLIATGAPQALAATGHIGPLPDLFRAVNGLDFTPPSVSFTDGPAGATDDPTPTFSFSALDEGAVTYRCRVIGVTAPASCTSPHTTAPLADGAWTFEVVATDAMANSTTATRAFTVDTRLPAPAPAAPTVGSSDEAPPQPVPAPAPAPATATADKAPSVAPLSIGPGAKMTVRAASDGWVRLQRPRVSCAALAASCKLITRARPAAGGRQIGGSLKSVTAGASATVGFRLTKSARAALRRRGSLKATVKIEARQGSVLKTRTVSLTIKR